MIIIPLIYVFINSDIIPSIIKQAILTRILKNLLSILNRFSIIDKLLTTSLDIVINHQLISYLTINNIQYHPYEVVHR